MINKDIEYISAIKLKFIEDNLSNMILDDLLKLRNELNRNIEAKAIAKLVSATVEAIEQSKNKGD